MTVVVQQSLFYSLVKCVLTAVDTVAAATVVINKLIQCQHSTLRNSFSNREREGIGRRHVSSFSKREYEVL